MLDADDMVGSGSCWNERPYLATGLNGAVMGGSPPDSDVFYNVESLLVESSLENMKCVKLDSSNVSGNGGRLPASYMDMMSCQTSSSSSSLVDGSALSSLLLQEGMDDACGHLVSDVNGVGNGGGNAVGCSSSTSNNSHSSLNLKCGLCHETYTSPKVLPCFHTFCQLCLEKTLLDSGGGGPGPDIKLECPRCHQDCVLPTQGVSGLLADYAVTNILESSLVGGGGGGSGGGGGGECAPASLHCTACKSKESNAIARCFDCTNFLCSNCVMAHQFMHCFEGHRVMTLGEMQNGVKGDEDGGLLLGKAEKAVSCPRHAGEVLRYFCKSCSVPICQECTLREHPKGHHDYEYLSDIGAKQVGGIGRLIEEGKMKMGDLRGTLKGVEHSATRLQVHYHKAQAEIGETFQFYRSVLEERQQDALKELDGVYSAKQMALGVACQRLQESIDRTHQTCEFMERLLKYATNTEVLLFKKLLDVKLQQILNYTPDLNLQTAYDDVEFISNYQAIQVGVRNTFGYIRSNAAAEAQAAQQNSKPQPIARPTGSNGNGNGGHGSNGNGSGMAGHHLGSNGGMMNGGGPSHPSMTNGIGGMDHNRPYMNGHMSSFESNILSKRFSSANNLGPFSTTLTDLNPYEKWSGGNDCGGGGGGGNMNNHNSIFQNGVGGGGNGSNSDHHGGHHHHFHMSNTNNADAMAELSHKLISMNTGNGGNGGGGNCNGGNGGGTGNGTSSFPPKSQIKRQKMIYHCKFGEFGVMEGQFTEPSGVAVNAQNDIIVADTNNHRIQIFDKEGRFKFQFGECGKRDGQLLYPNRVSVVKTSGDIIVTERSPTHQIQIYNQYGQFVRKFGANILQHPRGVTVDHKGRVVVVECKVMRVIIFDQMGAVLQKFGCSKHLEFPNGVVVNDKQEIFISDNRAHCVKVFNYEGVYLRQIGGEGITNYPIGVGINQAGEILIADNHNNFNLTIFSQDGTLVNALESKVKHAQCFDVALMDDGSVVLASKDYRLYIYRYLQLPSVGL